MSGLQSNQIAVETATAILVVHMANLSLAR